jgi:preprotein translocase subunit SecB
MQTSPLRLDESFIGEISVKAAEAEVHPVGDVQVDADLEFARHETDSKKWKVRLLIRFKGSEDKPIPYMGSVEITGFFTVIAEMDELKHTRLVAVNCPSILYSTARDVVAMLTARGPYGQLLLPSVSFIDQQIGPPEPIDTPGAEAVVGSRAIPA